jgi:hypothetical protein
MSDGLGDGTPSSWSSCPGRSASEGATPPHFLIERRVYPMPSGTRLRCLPIGGARMDPDRFGNERSGQFGDESSKSAVLAGPNRDTEGFELTRRAWADTGWPVTRPGNNQRVAGCQMVKVFAWARSSTRSLSKGRGTGTWSWPRRIITLGSVLTSLVSSRTMAVTGWA